MTRAIRGSFVASYEKQGVRVLAVAAKTIAVSSRFEQSPTEVNGMVLVGFAGFVDPIKSTARWLPTGTSPYWRRREWVRSRTAPAGSRTPL